MVLLLRQDSSCLVVLKDPARFPLPLSPTGLSPSLVCFPSHIRLFFASALSQLLQPHISMVWAFPLSLAATRESLLFFFSPGTWMVSVPRVPLLFRMASFYSMPGSPIRIPARLSLPYSSAPLSQFGASFSVTSGKAFSRTPLPP